MSYTKTSKTTNDSDQITLYPKKEELRPFKTIRIAVSNDVQLTQLEVGVIDTPQFQRLRKLRQLGTAHFVYPSAMHTRFEHSLGVLKMADIMINSIRENPYNEGIMGQISVRQKKLIRLVALLHDIANIPFGHTLEDETNVISSYQEDEARFEKYIGKDKELGKLLYNNLGNEDYELLRLILTSKDDTSGSRENGEINVLSDLGENAFMVDIVKNTVCADLLDYLQRDSYFCNLPLRIPDRFLQYIYIHSSPESNIKRLAIRLWKSKEDRPRADIISELIQLLEIRYFLAERVYFHHTKQSSSAMVGACVWQEMHKESSSLSQDKLSEMGDDELIDYLQQSNDSITKRLAESINTRKLYKRFKFSIEKDRLRSEKIHDLRGIILNNYHLDANNRTEVERRFAERAGLEPGDVIIYCPNPNMNLKMASMKVTWHDDIETLQKINDPLIKNKIESILEAHKQLWQLQIFVRENVLESPTKKNLLMDLCRAEFKDFDNTFNEGLEQHAYRAMIEDVIRTKRLDVNIQKIDSLVEKAAEMTHGGEEFSRSVVERLLKEQMSSDESR